MILTRIGFTIFAAALAATAQDVYPHHNLSFDFGAARPSGEIQSFMASRPGIGFSYGYRFHRYLQADLGLNMVFGAAQIRDFLPTDIGNVQLRDREYFVPMGARAIAPFAHGRLLFAGGGGMAYLRYSESLNQPSYYYQVDCPVCTSRGGWGPYGLVNGTYFLDHDQHFRVGLTTMFYRAHTNGDALGNLPGSQTTDHWTNIFGEIGFSF